jgi:predicted lipoprotein with Yx(FWY)xxD motif
VRKVIFGTALLMALVLAGSACGGDNGGGNGSGDVSTTTKTAANDSRPTGASRAKQTTTVKVMQTRYGRILVDGKGRALYLFTKEGGPKARCYGGCAQAWPVFYAPGQVRAGRGAKGSLIGTTRRRDGRRQVTYAGHPLYYYVTDRKPGEVTCQNVVEFGGTWLVVAPSGAAIR